MARARQRLGGWARRRSFVAEGAPLDDGHVRFWWKDCAAREAERAGRREGLYVGLSNRFAHAGFAIGGACGGMLPLETDSSEES
jgi:hypothetical protein